MSYIFKLKMFSFFNLYCVRLYCPIVFFSNAVIISDFEKISRMLPKPQSLRIKNVQKETDNHNKNKLLQKNMIDWWFFPLAPIENFINKNHYYPESILWHACASLIMKYWIQRERSLSRGFKSHLIICGYQSHDGILIGEGKTKHTGNYTMSPRPTYRSIIGKKIVCVMSDP